MKNIKIRIITEVVRVNYVHLVKPYIFPGTQEAKYSLTAIIPTSDSITLGVINNTINEIMEESFKGIWGDIENVEDISTPLKNGDATSRDEYKNALFINCSSKYAPEIVDGNLNTISPTEVKSGDYCRLSLTFYNYYHEETGMAGIGCYLNNIQKVADGQPIYNGGAKSDFAAVSNDDF